MLSDFLQNLSYLSKLRRPRKQEASLTIKPILLKQHSPLQNTLSALLAMNILNLSPLPLASCPLTPSAPISHKGTSQTHVSLTPKLHSGMDPATEFSYRFSFSPDLGYLRLEMAVDAIPNACFFFYN